MPDVRIRYRSDSREVETGAKRVQRTFDNLKSGALKVGAAIAGAFAVRKMAQFGASITRAAFSFDAMKRGLQAVIPEGENVSEILERIEELAKQPGLGFREALEGVTRLRAVGLAAAESEAIIREFGNSVAMVGGGRAELQRAVEAISNMGAEGKVTQERLNQLALVMPTIRGVMQDTFGVATAEGIRNLGISVEEFQKRLVSGMSEQQRASGGAQNAVENLSDSIDQLKIRLGETFAPTLVAGIEKVSAALEGVEVSANSVETAALKMSRALGVEALGKLGQKIGDTFSNTDITEPFSKSEVAEVQNKARGKRVADTLMEPFEEAEKRAHEVAMKASQREAFSEMLNFGPPESIGGTGPNVESLFKLAGLAEVLAPVEGAGNPFSQVASSLARVGGGGGVATRNVESRLDTTNKLLGEIKGQLEETGGEDSAERAS